MFGVQPDVFVEVTRVSERPGTHWALERLVARVCPDVDLEPVLARIDFAAVDTNVAVFGAAQVADDGLHLSCRTRSGDTGPGMNPMLLLLLLIIAGRHAERRHLEQMSRCRFANDISRRLELDYWRHFRAGRGRQHVEDSAPQGGRRDGPVGTMEEQVKFERIRIDKDTGASVADVSVAGLDVFWHKERHFKTGQHRLGKPEIQSLALLHWAGRREYQRQMIVASAGLLGHHGAFDILHPAFRRHFYGHRPQVGRRIGNHFTFSKSHLSINHLI